MAIQKIAQRFKKETSPASGWNIWKFYVYKAPNHSNKVLYTIRYNLTLIQRHPNSQVSLYEQARKRKEPTVQEDDKWKCEAKKPGAWMMSHTRFNSASSSYIKNNVVM